ncbi:MAG: LamG domain-containing protein, partial [Coriobacteriales bacterium]|nr:LamG domain-containing protein [Coriobacteriales bacterium]
MANSQNKNSFTAYETANKSWLEHGAIPDFDMGGGNPFTFELTFLYMGDTAHSVIYAQDGVFSISLDTGSFAFDAPGFCSIATMRNKLVLEEQSLYSFAVRYDGADEIALFFQGYKIGETVKTGTLQRNDNHYVLGKGAVGGIVSLRAFSRALDDKEIFQDATNPFSTRDGLASQFFFKEVKIADSGPYNLPVFVEGTGAIPGVRNYVPCMHFRGQGCAFAQSTLGSTPAAYTVLGKGFVNYSSKSEMVVLSNVLRETGYVLFLRAVDNSSVKLVFKSGSLELLSTGTIFMNDWFDFALSYDGETVKLFLNGEEAASTKAQGLVLEGSANRYLGAEANSSGVITYSRGLMGNLSYVAEFSAALPIERIQGYA